MQTNGERIHSASTFSECTTIQPISSINVLVAAEPRVPCRYCQWCEASQSPHALLTTSVGHLSQVLERPLSAMGVGISLCVLLNRNVGQMHEFIVNLRKVVRVVQRCEACKAFLEYVHLAEAFKVKSPDAWLGEGQQTFRGL